MQNEKFWIRLSIINFSVVALVGMTLRTKILFSLPFIDYNFLLDGHSHFAFGGWATLALMTLMIGGILPDSKKQKTIYQWLLGGIALNSWIMLFTFSVSGNGFISNLFNSFFIVVTYIFSGVLIADILKSKGNRSVALLSIASLICLVISSVGPFGLMYLFASKSLNVILYKDALYTYLHFQYNGFFTLAVFALFINHLKSKISDASRKNFHRFSWLLVATVVPSQFLTYLWEGRNNFFFSIAILGSITLLLCLLWFIILAVSLSKANYESRPLAKMLTIFFLSAFILKTFLQSFTIFQSVGNAVFGDRPIIIGFLHLAFLGLLTIFLLAYFSQHGFLNTARKFTRVALLILAFGIIFNEAVLMTQGLVSLLLIGSNFFQWLLWIASIWMFAGAIMISIANTKQYQPPSEHLLY